MPRRKGRRSRTEPRLILGIPPSSKVCVPNRCGLCRFPLDEGDSFVAVGRTGELLPDVQFTRNYKPPNINLWFTPCYKGCTNEHESQPKIYACHAGCIEQVTEYPLIEYLRAYNSITECEPPLDEDKRRTIWLRSHLAPTLCDIFRRMPAELCWEIATYCVREHCVKLAGELMGSSDSSSGVSTAKNVWANYKCIDGMSYLVALTNVCPQDGAHPILRANRRRARGTFYLARDHFGIRDIRFISQPATEVPAVSVVPGVWWNSFSTVGMPSAPRLLVKGDILRLHSVSTERIRDDQSVFAWAVPHAPGSEPGAMALRASYGYFGMTLFNLNDPDITGYSFFWRHGLSAIHVHRKSEPQYRYPPLPANPKHTFWFHLPINHGECISKIWVIDGWMEPHCPSWIIKTNKGRLLSIGPYTRFLNAPPMPPMTTRLAYDRKVHSNRFHLCQSTSRIRAFSCHSPVEQFHVSLPAFPHASFLSARDYPLTGFHTFANLADVVKITPCRHVDSIGDFICGLLFEYASGGRACVGQIRFDRLDKPLVVESGSCLCLGSYAVESWMRVVSCNTYNVGPPNKGVTYHSYEWRGTLDWRSSTEQDIINHNLT